MCCAQQQTVQHQPKKTPQYIVTIAAISVPGNGADDYNTERVLGEQTQGQVRSKSHEGKSATCSKGSWRPGREHGDNDCEDAEDDDDADGRPEDDNRHHDLE